MPARIENAAIQLLTRACLDWTAKYPATTAALAKLKVESPISTANFAVFVRMARHRSSLRSKPPSAGAPVWSISPSTSSEIEGDNLMTLPLSERKSRLASLLTKPRNGIKFSDHEDGDGDARHGLEGLVGWSDPTRPFLGFLLLGFHER